MVHQWGTDSPEFKVFPSLRLVAKAKLENPINLIILSIAQYIYIYIVIHRQVCFVLSEHISVARHTSFR